MRTQSPFHIMAAALALVAIVTVGPTSAQDRTAPDPTRSSQRDDRALVATLIRANRAEITQSQAALPKLQNPDVKQFAEQLIEEHTKAYDRMNAIATRLGYPPSEPGDTMTRSGRPVNGEPPVDSNKIVGNDTMPQRGDPKQGDPQQGDPQTPAAGPESPASSAFPQPTAGDRQYIESQVTMHQQILGQLPANENTVQDRELRSVVVETRRSVESHLAEARRLRDKMGRNP